MSQSTTNRSLIKNHFINGLNAAGETTSNWDLNALKGAGAILSNVSAFNPKMKHIDGLAFDLIRNL